MVIPDWECVCLSTNCGNGNGSVAAVRQMQYDTIHVWPFVSSASHSEPFIMGGTLSTFDFIWVHFFSPFNGYTHYYYTYLRWIQLQCATITRSFKRIVRVLHDEERKTKLRQWQAASGHAMVSFLSVDSISLAKGKMVSANDEMTNTSQMRWAKGRASERRRQNETKRVRAFNISRKSTQSYFISGLPNTLKSAHVSSRTRATKQMPSHGLARCCRQTRRCIVRLEWCSVFTLVHTGRAIEWYPPKRKKTRTNTNLIHFVQSDNSISLSLVVFTTLGMARLPSVWSA